MSIPHGKKPCVSGFEYYGNDGDKELVEHQKLEKDIDSKDNWWIGFEVDKRFENLKEQAQKIKDDKLRL